MSLQPESSEDQSPSDSCLDVPLELVSAALKHRLDFEDVEASRERCRSLAGFVREAWHVLEPSTRYVHSWHLDFLCRHLEAITRGELLALGLENRLLVNVPPGTMKSLLVGVFWPAFEWGPAGQPHLRYLTASYSKDYANRDCRKMRDLVASEWYRARWDTKLVRCGDSSITNTAGGGRDAVPYESLTSGRGDRLILDDPNSVKTAESDTQRERAGRTFRESATNRLNDPITSAIIVVMQRLHEDDISGTILKFGMPYVHVMLPMRFEPERCCATPFGKDPRTTDGELLFPERFPPEVVDRDEAIMLDYAVAGQHQQRPSPRGGGSFKAHWFETVAAAPAGTRWVRGWDLAGTKGKKSPYTVGVKLGVWQGTYYIGHIVREREPAETVEILIQRTAQQDGRAVEQDLPQDPGQSGKFQVRYLVKQLAGYVVHFSTESGSKPDRAKPVAGQAKAGNVKIVEGPWNAAFLEEASVFPNGSYLDQIDALSRAFSRVLMSAPSDSGFAAPRVLSGGRG